MLAAWPDGPGVLAALLILVVVFSAVYVGFEKWCRRKGWGELSDYPEGRHQKHLRWLLNFSAHGLINVLLIRALDW